MALLSVSGFESSKTVQVRIYNVTTATEVVAWTTIGVAERADGQGYSIYHYNYSLSAGQEYIVDWKDNSTPIITASEGISNLQSGVTQITAKLPTNYIMGSSVQSDKNITIDTIAVDVAGIDGAAMRGTDNAALASVCTEVRLSELDAATAGKTANEVDLIKAESLTHPTLAEIEATTILAKEASITNIPAAVWAYTTRTLSSFGSIVSEIATAVWTYTARKLTSAYTDEIPSRDMAATGGASGINQITLTVYITGGVIPIPDYHVTILNQAGSLLIGTVLTDSMGVVKFNLNNGTYLLRGRKDEYIAGNPTETIVVTSDMSKTIYATAFVPPAPPTPDIQTLYGWITNLKGDFLADIPVTATLTVNNQIVNGELITMTPQKTSTDIGGYFKLFVPKGAKVTIASITDKTIYHLNKNITVTNDAAMNLDAYVT